MGRHAPSLPLPVEHALDVGGDGAGGVGLEGRDGHHRAVRRDLLAAGGLHSTGLGVAHEAERGGAGVDGAAGQGHLAGGVQALDRTGLAVAGQFGE